MKPFFSKRRTTGFRLKISHQIQPNYNCSQLQFGQIVASSFDLNTVFIFLPLINLKKCYKFGKGTLIFKSVKHLKQLPKFKTSMGINFGYSYPIFMNFLPFDFIFKCLSKLVV